TKDIEKAGVQADQGLNKMTKSFKDAIKEQKELIKTLENEVKKLQKAYDDAAAGQRKSNLAVDLRSAKSSLALQNDKLLKLQQAQIDANKAEEGSINSLIGGLGKWVMGLVSVGAALKIAKGIIDSSTESALKFHQITAGATAGVQYFFKAISSDDWSNFFGGLERAIEGATDFVERMEELENLQNEIRVRGSKYDIEIAKYREDTFDKEDLNNDKRLNALTEIIRLTKLKYSEEADYQTKLYAAQLKNAADMSGLEEDKIEQFITEYSSLEEMLKLGKEYNKLTKLSRAPGMEGTFLQDILNERDALGENAKQAGEYAKQISKVTMEVRKGLSTTLTAKQEAESKTVIGSRRDEMQKAQLENEIANDKIENAKIENKIKKEQELIDKAIKENNQVEIKITGERIRILQEELVVRKRIAEYAIAATMTRETPISKITGLKAPTLLPEGLKIPNTLAGAPTKDSGDYIKGTAMLSKQGWTNQKKESKEYDKDAEESLKKQLELRNNILQAATSLVNQIGQQVGLDEKSMSLLNAGMNALTALETGDLPGAALALLSGVISQIPSSAAKFEAQIEHINQLLEEQARLIELSEQTGGQEKERKEEIDLLEKEKEALIARRDHIQKYGGGIFWTNAKTQREIENLNNQIKETENLIEDAGSAYNEFITGTTALAVADAISQGFQNGETSIADFADTFNEFMVQAINSALTEMSKPEIAAWYKQFAIDMESGGGLTKEEIAALKIDWDKIITEGKANRDAVAEATGLNLYGETDSGISGQIQRSITEQTGTELAGLFRRFADDNRTTKDYTLLGLNNLTKIEANTYGSWQELIIVNTKLDSVIANTRSQYTSPIP
ncbi:MAG: hypothetical protein M0P71_18010, partial [Melioribacteraceae bacterium]|nr:hypothetical protein [Melioribacteraceae bacterium]